MVTVEANQYQSLGDYFYGIIIFQIFLQCIIVIYSIGRLFMDFSQKLCSGHSYSDAKERLRIIY